MPFGLHSPPAIFQRLTDKIISPDFDPLCFAYLDDIDIVLGETFEHHLSMLSQDFNRLKAANLRINSDKCQFGRKSLRYLGYLISGHGTDPEKVSAIQKLPSATTIKGVRRFLGSASWYRRFVKKFSKIAAPLNRLLKKGVK